MKNQKNIKSIFWVLVALLSSASIPAQIALPTATSPYIPSASAASFGKYTDIPVNLFTGTPSINIPIYTLSEGPLSHNISISYHAAGNKVNSIASPIGLGWHLNAGGIISRTVVGIADDKKEGYVANRENVSVSDPYRKDVAEGKKDGAPDIYSFSFPGYAGKFTIDYYNDIVTIPKSNLKIQKIHTACSTLEGFIITTPDGTVYHFGFDPGEEDLSCDDNDEQQYSKDNNAFDESWHLERITTYDQKHFIDFEYDFAGYSYKAIKPCKVLSYWNGSAQVADRQCYDYQNPPYDDELIIEVNDRVLDSIITSTTIVTFGHFGRHDLEDNPQHNYTLGNIVSIGVPTGIDEIVIEEGDDYGMKYQLYQSYFTDPSVSDSLKNRLRLDSLKLVSVSESGLSEPAYRFEYYTRPGDPDFFPTYNSKQIDHWGYYNGASGNDALDEFMPATTIKDDSGNTLSYGSADRDTDADSMKIGMLKRITYPTHGHTEFEYEANSYYKPDTALIYPIIIYSCNTECGGETSASDEITITDDMLQTGTWELCLTVFDDGGIQDLSKENNYGRFEVWNADSTDQKWYKEFNDSVNICVTMDLEDIVWKRDSMQHHLRVDSTYLFVVRSDSARADLTIRYSDYSAGDDVDVGGFRIKKVTTHDNIDSDDDIIRSYTYQHSSSATYSSGNLHNEPKYAFRLDAANVLFSNYSMIPLSSFEGYHIGYERVEVDYNGSGRMEYLFYDENYNHEYDKYPAHPEESVALHGFMEESYTYKESGTQIASQLNSYNPAEYENVDGLMYVVDNLEPLSGASGLSDYPTHPFGYQRGLTLPKQTINTLDGVIAQSDLVYNTTELLAPIKSYMINSDGKLHETLTKYTKSYASGAIKDSLTARHILTIPYQTQRVVAGDTLDGSKITFSLFDDNGTKDGSTGTLDPYPYYSERFERTWTDGTLQTGSWVKQGTINSYDSLGLVKEYTKEGWEKREYEYNSDKLLTKSIFEDHESSYEYHPGSKLIKKKTAVDGTTMSYTYDGLMRLKTVTDDCNGAKTMNEYGFQESDSEKSYQKTIQIYSADSEGNSAVDTIETYKYIDGLSRPIETVLKKQHHDGVNDIVIAQEYNKQGLVDKKYVPQSNNGNGAYKVPYGGWDKYKYSFEPSPLHRLSFVESPDPQWNYIWHQYGSNGSGILKDGGPGTYGVKTLSTKTITDTNGNSTTSFTDKTGRTILVRKPGNIDTYTLYDDKDRVETVIPPGATTITDNLLFSYEYDGSDNLLWKKIPDKDTVFYLYNDRDLLSLQQDGNMQTEDLWYAYAYDNYGRETVSGFYTDALPSGSFSSVSPNDTLTLNVYGTTGISLDKITSTKTVILNTEDWLETNFSYDDCGRVSQTVSNNSLLLDEKRDTVSYTYDEAGNVTQNIYSHYTNIDTFQITNRYELDHVGRLDGLYFTLDYLDEYQLSSFDYNEKDEITKKQIGETTTGFLQTLDYTYLRNGLLSKINESSLSGSDLFHTQLYYKDPYTGSSATSRKNGDIVNAVWKNEGENERVYSYKYDNLNRLTQGDYFEMDGATKVNEDDYNTKYSYDDRGNITSLSRKGAYGDIGNLQKSFIDSLEYDYYTSSNQLKGITDSISSQAGEEGYKSVSVDTFAYDANGNLINDPQKGITMSYNHLDLVDTIKMPGEVSLVFTYDASGGLLRKEAFKSDTVPIERRDYLGNIEYTDTSQIVIYHSEGRVHNLGKIPEQKFVQDTLYSIDTVRARELYVSSFIRQIRGSETDSTQIEFIGEESVNFISPFESDTNYVEYSVSFDTFDLGGWRHEFIITDHLGNTRLVFSDIDTSGSIDSSEILQRLHYYPFGLRQKGSWMTDNTAKVSYQYNSIEYLDEYGLDVNMASFRTLDPAVGRWWSLDVDAEQFPGMSPYNSMLNSPIVLNDPNGDNPLLIGAAIGLVSNGVGNLASGNGFFDGAFQSAFMGAMGGGISNVIGNVAGGINNSWSRAAFQIGAHSSTGGLMSYMQGGSFSSGAAAGGVSSGVGSGIGALGGGSTSLWLGGGLSGGLGSLAAGGSFLSGAGQGLLTSGLNHAAEHLLGSSDPPGIDYNEDGVVTWQETLLTAIEYGGYAFDILTFPSGEGVAMGLIIRGVGRKLAIEASVKYTKHALIRMTERGITKKMTQKAISKGIKYYDPKNKTFNYVLKNGFASGKDLLVGTNTVTGRVTTVIRGNNLVKSRFLLR